MTPAGKKLYRVGRYGNTVMVWRRGASGVLYLRFTSGGEQTDRSLDHRDLDRAKEQARDLSNQLSSARASTSGAPGATLRITVAELFARYKVEVSENKKGTQPAEDARRRTLWLAYLGPNKRAAAIAPTDIETFAGRRKRGEIVVDGLDLKDDPKPTTIVSDVTWLNSVFNWAVRGRILTENPIRGAKLPQVSGQLRPIATAERADRILNVAPLVHTRFPLFVACVRALGWRVSAVCQLQVDDFRRTDDSTLHPYGEVRKRAEFDKEGMEQWLPMPLYLRDEWDAAGIIGTGWVFPSERDPKRPWSRWRARDLLELACFYDGLDDIEGGDWHPFRRLWATERKQFPLGDIANAGAWKDQRTVEKYIKADPVTTSQVMLYSPSTNKTSEETRAETRAPSDSFASTGTD